MNDYANSLYDIEETLNDIRATFLASSIGGYKGAAFYVQSSENPHSVLAAMHKGRDLDDQQRADKYVYRRRLPDSSSVAGSSFDQGKIEVAESMMFGKAHCCIHFPVDVNMHGADASMLQLVFTGEQDKIADKIIEFSSRQDFLRALKSPSRQLVRSLGDNRDERLHARNLYMPDHVIMNVDISGYAKIANKVGHERAHDFASDFIDGYVKGKARDYGAKVLRYEGDGIWLGMPMVNVADLSSRQQAVNHSYALLKDIISGYEEFAATIDRAFEGSRLKGVMEMGELKTYTWQDPENKQRTTQDHSGPSFTFMRRATQAISSDQKKNHVILAGAELMATLNNEETFYVDNNNFQSLDTE